MSQTLYYFSRHAATDEQKKLIEKCLIRHSMRPFYQATEEKQYGHEYVHTEAPFEVQQVSFNLETGIEAMQVALELPDWEYPEKGDEVTLAGVFPADFLGHMVEYALRKGIYLNVITFKYERDRETCTVMELKYATVWQVENGVFSMKVVFA